jgi:DNA repair protein RecO (recombination protein O)
VRSPLSEPVDYARATALAFFVEILEETLPDHDPQDHVFRLLLSVLEQTRVGSIWMPVTYFAVWVTRLMGWLPDLSHCLSCGTSLAGSAAYFHPGSDGLFCPAHERLHGGPSGRNATLSNDSQSLATRILRTPVSGLADEPWPRNRAADLRRFAIQSLERHLERRLTTALALARLSA